MNKFEQLIEYVINNEESKARELFHDIVVEKSRSIYEEMMEAEEVEEAEDKDDKEKVEEQVEEVEEDAQEELEETLGGDQTEDLINDVETEESGMNMEDEESGEEEEESGEDLEDRVVDLEDKLDELMAEFEALMGDEAGEEHGDMDSMDAEIDGPDGMTDLEVADDELETEGMKMPMEEAVTLKAAPAPVKSEESGINKKPVVAANSGARGAMAKPVHTGANEGGHHDSAAYRNTTKELIGTVGNTPAQSTQKPTPGPKAQLAQAPGVNAKSVIQ